GGGVDAHLWLRLGAVLAVINTAARVYLTIAGLAIATCLVYNGVVGDRVGVFLFFSLFLAALLSGVAAVGPWVLDRARYVPADAPIEQVVVGRPVAPRPSSLPIVAAAAVGVLAVGTSVGAWMVIVGFILAAV